MRIAVVGSIWISSPPDAHGFGAQEYLAYKIAEGMQKKGHDVTLFAVKGNIDYPFKIESISDTPISKLRFPDPKIKDMHELINLSAAYSKSREFDIIHNHLLPYGLLFAPLALTQTVHTLHHQIYSTRSDIFLYQKYKNQNFISISNFQRKIFPSLNYIDTVYNGVETDYYQFKDIPQGNYILYIGRLKRYKGIHTAIRIAKELKIHLKIASPMPAQTQPDYQEIMQYWNTLIKPGIGNNIEHINEIKGQDKIHLLQNAKLLLFPVEREEPFGMTLIEAMSCGTPVVAYALGATSEIIEDGKTGYLVNFAPEIKRGDFIVKKTGYDGLKEAAQNLLNLNNKEYMNMRLQSRIHAERNFDITQMVNHYETLYNLVLKRNK